MGSGSDRRNFITRNMQTTTIAGVGNQRCVHPGAVVVQQHIGQRVGRTGGRLDPAARSIGQVVGDRGVSNR